MRSVRITVTAALTLFASGWLAAAPESLLVTGIATHPDNRQPAYSEHHTITREHHSVRYLGTDESLLASKQLDYTQGYNTPVYTLEDMRFARQTGSLWQDGAFVVFQQEKSGKRHEKTFAPGSQLVIDAGFDHFIRSHWAALVAGEVLPFTFVVADPLVALDMQLQQIPAADSLIADKRDDYRYFVANSSHRLISWAIPEIHVAYDEKEKLLRIYQGLSNITDGNDKRQNVLIRYTYESLPQIAQGDRQHEQPDSQ
jgi:hypothetical protein